jgi:peroxiredoxin
VRYVFFVFSLLLGPLLEFLILMAGATPVGRCATSAGACATSLAADHGKRRSIPAPDFSLPTPDGEQVTLSQYRGRVVLLDFWATWSKPCLDTMRELDKLHVELAPRGFTVLGVAIDDDAKQVEKRLAKHPVSYPIALDGGDAPVWAAYRVRTVPTTFLVDRAGCVVQQWTGEVPLATVRDAVLAALAEAAR